MAWVPRGARNMINFEDICHSERWRYGNHRVSISKNDELDDVTIEVDPPNELMSDFIKYLLAIKMKHNKWLFKKTTIHHIPVKTILRNHKIKAHYKELKLQKKPH